MVEAPPPKFEQKTIKVPEIEKGSLNVSLPHLASAPKTIVVPDIQVCSMPMAWQGTRLVCLGQGCLGEQAMGR